MKSTGEMLAHALRIKFYFEKNPIQDASVLASLNILIEKLEKQLAQGI